METEILATSNTQKRLASHSAQLWPGEPENSHVKRFKAQQCDEHENVGKRFKQHLQKNIATCVALSPITELAKNMHDTNLSTPTAIEKSGSRRFKHFRDLQIEFESGDATLYDDGIDHPAKVLTHEHKDKLANELLPLNSLSSTFSTESNSLDDEYLSLFEMESECNDENSQPATLKLPSDLDTLISGKLNQDTFMPIPLRQNDDISDGKTVQLRRPRVRRCLSLLDNKVEPQSVNESLDLKSPHTPLLSVTPDVTTPIRRTLQRTKPLATSSSNNTKVLRKCMSMNDAQIMTALARSEQIGEPELIGDFSKPCALPLLTTGQRHCDLKTISSDTLARLMAGEFDNVVTSYHIIDCRYPYEYLGGHIQGATNLYTHEQITSKFPTLLQPQKRENSEQERHILIFHCEFSSERGPKLMRFLRNNDRATHTNVYPELNYPELYLLHNGYKEFYETTPGLCEPCGGYVPMLSPAHSEQYRLFRAKSKSWQGDGGPGGTALRTKKSRSRLALQDIE